MPARLTIDFISDVSCPWCAIALNALEAALANLGEIDADPRFEPFELNPGMARGGEDIAEHLRGKYGSSAADISRTHERLAHDRGIHAVPAVIINDRYLIEGGQPVPVFENALKRIVAEPAQAS
jgi:predicted DsbA family dithiol-disulfide isomerase